MKIAVLPNLTKKDAYLHTCRVVEALLSYGGTVFMHAPMKKDFFSMDISFFNDFNTMLIECDSVIAVGGDGTIIHAAKHAAQAGKPILGINVGRLGFVAGLEVDELDRLKDLVSGQYTVENRMMLEVTVSEEDGAVSLLALNDAVLSRGALSRILDLKVSQEDNHTLCEYRADGLIVATPTGSTAYSLSAGGPVIDPSLHCILVTPICPHSLFTRTVVFGANSHLTVEADSGSEIFLTLDGETSIQLAKGETVSICRSSLFTKLIQLNHKGFYQVVNEKLAERRH